MTTGELLSIPLSFPVFLCVLAVPPLNKFPLRSKRRRGRWEEGGEASSDRETERTDKRERCGNDEEMKGLRARHT